MKDYVGQTLAVGDRVVHARSGRGGGFTGKYFVSGFTKSMVRIARPGVLNSSSVVHASNLVKVPFKEDIANG